MSAEVPRSRRQLSLFGRRRPTPRRRTSPGLLAGAGRGGRAWAVPPDSVDVDHAWRVHVLVAECAARGLAASWAQAEARAAHRADRVRHVTGSPGRRLARGRHGRPPAGSLDGRRLRLWVRAAAGAAGPARLVDAGRYAGPTDDVGRGRRIGAARPRRSWPAVAVGRSVRGGRRRTDRRTRPLARLAELVGLAGRRAAGELAGMSAGRSRSPAAPAATRPPTVVWRMTGSDSVAVVRPSRELYPVVRWRRPTVPPAVSPTPRARVTADAGIGGHLSCWTARYVGQSKPTAAVGAGAAAARRRR